LDKAGNKGTGSWTTIAACELGVPVPTLTAALFARYQSAFKNKRTNADGLYQLKNSKTNFDVSTLLNAYQVARILNHHQGIHLIQVASKTHEWDIDITEVSRIWTNGCIIRSNFMETLEGILEEEKELLIHPQIVTKVKSNLSDLRNLVGNSSLAGTSIPCFQATLSYIEIYSKSQSTANIIQGQSDYFGAHRYQRKDDLSETCYHTIWDS
jgi:6-phosphogluconate dehydrogenase